MKNRILILLIVCALIMTCNTVFADSLGDDADRVETGMVSSVVREEERAELLPSADPEGYLADDNDEPVYGYSETEQEDSVPLLEDADFKWDVTDNVLTVSGTGDLPDYSGSVVPWAEDKDSITSIVIEEGITGISDRLFMQMKALEEVSFPSTLNTLGEAAFYECQALENVSIPGSVKIIKSGTFAECVSIQSITFAEGVTTIQDYAFQNVAVENVTIPASLTSLSALAFWRDQQISAFDVAEGNTAYVSEDGIIFSSDKTAIIMVPTAKAGEYRIPDGTTTVGAYAFANNTGLTAIDLNRVETLEEGAFYLSRISSTIVLPDTLTQCGYFTFDSCHYLQGVVFGSGLTETPYRMFENCWDLSTIEFNPALKIIGMRTFNYCSSLKKVEIPDSVTEIQGAFGYCRSLEEFTANNVEEIWYANFAGDTKLRTVNLGKVKTINRESFNSCTSLLEIYLPESTVFVDETAFPQTTNIICANTSLTAYGRNGLQQADQIIISGKQHYDMAFQVLDLVNSERAKEGLSALIMDVELLDIAMLRAAEGSVLFSHTRPDSSICFSAGSRITAENIAVGQSTAAAVMDGWMNSEGHRANILDENSKYIGIGCFEINGTYVWAQNFYYGNDGEMASSEGYADVKDKKEQINLPCRTFTEAPTTAGPIFSFDKDVEYTYSYYLSCDPAIMVGGLVNASMYVNNPAWSMSVRLENECINWSSNNRQIITIDTNGKVSGIAKGNTEITGSLEYSSASKNIAVMDSLSGTTWIKDGGDWYLYTMNAVILTGWQKVNGKWYYLDPNFGGRMAVGWRKVNGKWYYLEDSGAMVTGWVKVNGVWYYMSSSGAMLNGWQKINNVWYYLKPSGAMASNEWCGGYWLSRSGAWTYKYTGSWKKNSKGWWFEDTSGWYPRNSTVKIDDVYYVFNSSGYWVDTWKEDSSFIVAPLF